MGDFRIKENSRKGTKPKVVAIDQYWTTVDKQNLFPILSFPIRGFLKIPWQSHMRYLPKIFDLTFILRKTEISLFYSAQKYLQIYDAKSSELNW